MRKESRQTSRCKLSGEERRSAILRAVRRVFAEKGFHGTTTRELADSAGISEALLFRHFPNKEALFSSMRLSLNEPDLSKFERIKGLASSTATLVLMVQFLASRVIEGWAADDEPAIQTRLMLRSLAEDGEFARVLHERAATSWIGKVEECIHAAINAGEAVRGPVSPHLGAWFAHHLCVMAMCELLPQTPTVNYAVDREELVKNLVWFALRGIGVNEEAICRHYSPHALATIENSFNSNHPLQ